jgi:hypothetical protein
MPEPRNQVACDRPVRGNLAAKVWPRRVPYEPPGTNQLFRTSKVVVYGYTPESQHVVFTESFNNLDHVTGNESRAEVTTRLLLFLVASFGNVLRVVPALQSKQAEEIL